MSEKGWKKGRREMRKEEGWREGGGREGRRGEGFRKVIVIVHGTTMYSSLHHVFVCSRQNIIVFFSYRNTQY